MPGKVYYNSTCPVCNAGIKDQRQRMENCGVRDIEWIDIHNHPDMASEVNNSLEQARERLHVTDAQGKLAVGADAFIYLWQQTPGQQWLARLLLFPVIRSLFRMTYNCFARLLYLWNRTLKHW